MKRIFLHGIVAGFSASSAGLVYFKLYQSILGTSFDKILNAGSIIGASVFGCILMAVGYFLLFKFQKEHLKGLLNSVIAVFSFVSILGAISINLPLDIENPELFPGLAVPMHFFPVLAFLVIEPFFRQKNQNETITTQTERSGDH